MGKQYGGCISVDRDIFEKLEGVNRIQYVINIREKVLDSACRIIRQERIYNPEIYLWDRHNPDNSIVYGWFIGSWDDYKKREQNEGFVLNEVVRVKTSEHYKDGQLFRWLKEKVLGIKPDPKTLNPYVK